MISDALNQQRKSNPKQYFEYIVQEHSKLQQLHQRSPTVPLTVEDYDLDSFRRRFEECIYREKARVDSNLLQLTSLFTKAIHDTRNKVFKHLDEQQTVFFDNVEFLKHQLNNYTPQKVNLPDFVKADFQTRLEKLHDDKGRLQLIDQKMNEISAAKRGFERNERERRNHQELIEKLRTAPEVLQKRNEDSYTTLFTRFENALKTLLDEYSPRGLKAFRNKHGPTEDFQVSFNDYFKPGVTPTMHYFEPETKILHLITLPAADSFGDKLASKRVSLDIEFKLPAYHGSIVTPEGRIFMMGGIDVLTNDNSNKRCYEFDSKTESLYKRSNMHTERFGFAFTYSKGKVYVFGGINSKGVLNSCESYDIFTDTWAVLPNMSIAAAHASVSNFKDRFIYKFGGYSDNQKIIRGIERYSIIERVWSPVMADTSSKLTVLPLSASAQVNSHQVLIFGGIGEDKKGSRTSLVLNVEQNWGSNLQKDVQEYVTASEQTDLPFGDGFWNPQTLVFGHRLYSLQNSTDKSGNVVGRRVLEFKNKTWNVLKL